LHRCAQADRGGVGDVGLDNAVEHVALFLVEIHRVAAPFFRADDAPAHRA